tara:strand:+ start:14883 stop:15254 length:372 start_codon:yes stop_codon:yes gene_type:complete
MNTTNAQTETIYGIFNGSKLIAFKECDTLPKLGRRMLMKTMKDEGIEISEAGILQYLESWCDWSQDMDEPCNDPELMIDQAVDTLVYSNIHWMNVKTRCQISNEDREIVARSIEKMLNRPFQK